MTSREKVSEVRCIFSHAKIPVRERQRFDIGSPKAVKFIGSILTK